jgi:hypothetical protein
MKVPASQKRHRFYAFYRQVRNNHYSTPNDLVTNAAEVLSVDYC